MNSKKNIPLGQSFKCAFKGLVSCVKTERNFRIHLCVLFYVVWFSHFYDFNKTQMAVLALAVGLVIAAELLNTAVEAVVDLVSPERNALAGLAKDIAAGGVFVSALTAVVVGLILFFDLDKLKEILDFYLNNPFHIILLAVSAIIWMLIIFLPVLLKKKG